MAEVWLAGVTVTEDVGIFQSRRHHDWGDGVPGDGGSAGNTLPWSRFKYIQQPSVLKFGVAQTE